MPLRLQVVSAHRESMGAAYIQEFAACGGTIGRSLECDWPLPDAKRYISSRHAMIDYQGGAYYLVDLSRNGVFVNGSDAPVGKGKPQRLFDGDNFRLGEFEISVAIIDDPTEGDEDGMQDSIVRAQLVPEDESVELAMLSADELSDSAPLRAMLEPGDESGQLSALNTQPPMPAPLDAGPSFEDAAAELLRAAGLDPREFAGMDPELLLTNAGALLAEFTEGIHDLLRCKDKLTVNMTSPNLTQEISNPLRAADGIDSALRLLLAPSNDVHMSGSRAVESAFDELSQHQQAVMTAMRNALDDYVGHFEPDALEQLFDRQKQRTGQSAKDFRELYKQAFQGLSRPGRNRLPQRFDEQFARNYEIETAE